ncbi:MAG: hypothetical protein II253_04250 [Lachnospiraceae bacterium]|nr:hypothetical protein [Lachnospiraceae bacterium]MBQ2106109.1 hypothetical protein [Lachnospiraceae bacterium]MBQ5915423.1 hypothetical protein [Lachnospiraceae bacterium]
MIKVSIISPRKSMDAIVSALEHQDFGCTFTNYVYKQLEEIKDIYEQCKDSSDVIFFSGELGYSYMLTHIDNIQVPCSFISYSEKDILSILLNFVVRYPHIPLSRIYIDFLSPVNDFMNLKKYLSPNYMPYLFENPIYNYETLKERAEELWNAGKIDMILTRTTNQLDVLNKLKIPYIYFIPDAETIRDSIRHAIDAIRLKQKNQAGKLVILIKLIYPEYISTQDRELLDITLHKYLLDFRKEFQYDFALHTAAHRFELSLDSDLYKTSFERIQDLITFLDETGELEFRLGAGFGKSLGESHYQAELALQESVKYGKNDGFIIHGEESTLTGPLSLTRTLNYSYSNTKALAYSQANGINESNLLKIVGLFQMDKDTVMTAASLSQWLNITSRSCNRILQQLLDSNLIEEIAPQKQEGKGRPTRQYRFNKQRFIQTFF